MLEVKNLDVAYGRIQIIWNLSLTIGNNEVVGVFGPNGAGKSTLINAIVGVVKAKSGEISFDGVPIHNQEPILLPETALWWYRKTGAFPSDDGEGKPQARCSLYPPCPGQDG